MATTNNQITGNLSVGASANIGGDGTVRGSVLIGHNLRVGGWIDAPNLKSPCKGLFRTADDLRDSHPTPRPGWWAMVGDTIPADIYVCRDGDWEATGQQGGQTDVAINDIDDAMDQLRRDVAAIDHPVDVRQTDDDDFVLADDQGHELMRIADGHVLTGRFDSSRIASAADITATDDNGAELSITDADGNAVMRIVGGHILTERFDSSNVGATQSTRAEVSPTRLLHIVVLGQSLAMGYGTVESLVPAVTRRALMFGNVRTWDRGATMGVTRTQYNADPELYDATFYQPQRLTERFTVVGTPWHSSSSGEHESICTGINEGLYHGYRAAGYSDMPMYTLTTLSGLSGQRIDAFDDADDPIMRRTLTDLEQGVALARDMGLGYRCVVVWGQGEFNTGGSDTSDATIEAYRAGLRAVYGIIRDKLVSMGVDTVSLRMLGYQTTARTQAGVTSTLAQASMTEPWYRVTYPYYAYPMASDNLHLSALGSRALGNAIGTALMRELGGGFVPLRIVRATRDGATVTLRLSGRVVSDADGACWDGLSAADRAAVQQHMGFWAYADTTSATDLVQSVQLVGDSAIRIVCTDVPAVVRYGFRQRDQRVLGGTIREAATVRGYQDTELRLYMPVQEVTTFDTKYDY